MARCCALHHSERTETPTGGVEFQVGPWCRRLASSPPRGAPGRVRLVGVPEGRVSGARHDARGHGGSPAELSGACGRPGNGLLVDVRRLP
jgi:hypothetical protein